MPELADELRDLGRHLAVGDDAGLAERVAAAMAAEPGSSARMLRRRRVVLAAIALAIASIGGVAAPAVADWWQMLVGGVEIRRSPTPPPTTQLPTADIGEALELGRRVPSHVDAAAASGLAVRRLDGQPPAQTWVGDVDGVAVVSLIYPPGESLPATASGIGVLLQQFASPLGQSALMTKFAGPDNRVHVVSVNGSPGVWVEGGHGIALRRGAEVLFVPSRLAANTLAWEVDGVTYRLESALDQDNALELARRLR